MSKKLMSLLVMLAVTGVFAAPTISDVKVDPRGFPRTGRNEVTVRSTGDAVPGKAFTTTRTGTWMELKAYSVECDSLHHYFRIDIDASADAIWGVRSECAWISFVIEGSGQGSDYVGIKVTANPSYKKRTGTVKIGTETFTVFQNGVSNLTFSTDPSSATHTLEAGNGSISVSATPDLPWTAESRADWLVLAEGSKSGSGNGTIAYTVSPNPTFYAREGRIVVTPDPASGLPSVEFVATQASLQATVSPVSHEFDRNGDTVSVNVQVPGSIPWQVENLPAWLTATPVSSSGSGTVTLQAVKNGTISPRSATIRIAGQDFSAIQPPQWSGVIHDPEETLIGKEGGSGRISVVTLTDPTWQAVSSDPSWLTLSHDGPMVGNARITFTAKPMETEILRIGTITIGERVIYVTQRDYDLTISPQSKKLPFTSGSGEVQVTTAAGKPWKVASTVPWITVDPAMTEGSGPATIRYTYTENTTDGERLGEIFIAGAFLYLTQGIKGTTSTKVPYEWLDTYFEGSDYEANAKILCPNGLLAWENYIAGLDPTDPEARLTPSISVGDDVVTITWDPDLNASSETRLYKLWSKLDLAEAEWHHPARTGDRFFRVTVDFPNGKDPSDNSGIAVKRKHKGVQLWENGPYWADTNIGAARPWDFGYSFWWGDTMGYTHTGKHWVSSDRSVHGFEFLEDKTPTSWKDRAALLSEGWITASGNLAPAHDAARVHWGDGWRMPTASEMQALIDNTTTEWTTVNGVWGSVVRGKGAYSSASIFLPAVGYGSARYLLNVGEFADYWSSSLPSQDDSRAARFFHIYPSAFTLSSYYRYSGCPIRPIRDSAD